MSEGQLEPVDQGGPALERLVNSKSGTVLLTLGQLASVVLVLFYVWLTMGVIHEWAAAKGPVPVQAGLMSLAVPVAHALFYLAAFVAFTKIKSR